MKKIIYWIRGRSDGAAITVLLILIFLAINPFGIIGFRMRIGIGLPLLLLFGIWVSSKPNAMSLISKIKSIPKLLYWENLVTLIFFFGTAAYFTFLTELTFEPAPLLITSTFYLWMYLCTRRKEFPTAMFKISGSDQNIVSEFIHFMTMSSPASAIYTVGMITSPEHFKIWLPLSIMILYTSEEYIYGIVAKNLKMDIMLGYRARSRMSVKLKTQESTTLKFLAVRMPVDIIQGEFKVPLGMKWGGSDDVYRLNMQKQVGFDLRVYDNKESSIDGRFSITWRVHSAYRMDQIGGAEFVNTLDAGNRQDNTVLNHIATMIENISPKLHYSTIFKTTSFSPVMNRIVTSQTDDGTMSVQNKVWFENLLKRENPEITDAALDKAMNDILENNKTTHVIKLSKDGKFWDILSGALHVYMPILVNDAGFTNKARQLALESQAQEEDELKGQRTENLVITETTEALIKGGAPPMIAGIGSVIINALKNASILGIGKNKKE